jgi:hypothetical protein
MWGTRKCTRVQTVPLNVWIERVLLNVRFYLQGECIIQFYRTKQFQTDVPLVFSLCQQY